MNFKKEEKKEIKKNKNLNKNLNKLEISEPSNFIHKQHIEFNTSLNTFQVFNLYLFKFINYYRVYLMNGIIFFYQKIKTLKNQDLFQVI